MQWRISLKNICFIYFQVLLRIFTANPIQIIISFFFHYSLWIILFYISFFLHLTKANPHNESMRIKSRRRTKFELIVQINISRTLSDDIEILQKRKMNNNFKELYRWTKYFFPEFSQWASSETTKERTFVRTGWSVRWQTDKLLSSLSLVEMITQHSNNWKQELQQLPFLTSSGTMQSSFATLEILDNF